MKEKTYQAISSYVEKKREKEREETERTDTYIPIFNYLSINQL